MTLPEDVTGITCAVAGYLAPDPVNGVTPDKSLFDDLAYHSMAMIDLTFAIEEVFDLDPIEPEVLDDVGSVGDLVTYVEKEVAAGRGRIPDSSFLSEWFVDFRAELDAS